MLSTPTDQLLKIGEVAQQSGLSVKTIRYYEEIGLLAPTTERSETGYRLFHPQVLNRLAFIRRIQTLGLSLAEAKHILDIHDRGQLPCGEVQQHLQAKVTAITEQIEALQTLRSELKGILSGWQNFPSSELANSTICPNLQSD